MRIAKDHANYFTATCLEWTNLLKEDRFKQIIIDSLQFLTDDERVDVFSFCIMHNHMHLIWQIPRIEIIKE